MPPTMSSADAVKARRRRGWYCRSWTGVGTSLSQGDDDVFYDGWWTEKKDGGGFRQQPNQQQQQQVGRGMEMISY